MRIVLAAAVFIVAMAVDLRPGRADPDGPWCAAVVMGHSVVKSCHYRTFEECYPNILGGNRGSCEPNPYWYGRDQKPEKPRRHRKRPVNRD
jgi:hypothetical protein